MKINKRLLFLDAFCSTIGVLLMFMFKDLGSLLAWTIIAFPLIFLVKKTFLPFLWLPFFIISLLAKLYDIFKGFAYNFDYINSVYPLTIPFAILLLLSVIYIITSKKQPHILSACKAWLITIITILVLFLDIEFSKNYVYLPKDPLASMPLKMLIWSGLTILSASLYFSNKKLLSYTLTVLAVFSFLSQIFIGNYSAIGAVSTIFILSIVIFFAHKNNNRKLANIASTLAITRALFLIFQLVF